MKTTFLFKSTGFLVLSILLFTFSNCDKILEAFDIKSPFSTVFPINVGPDDELLFLESKTIDLNDNKDFADNKDKIDNYSVTRVYYKIVSYQGEAGILGSGTATFLDDTTQIGDAIVANDVNFSNLFESQQEVDLDVTDNTKNALVALLKDKMKFTIELEGLISDKPAYIEVEIFVVITANVKP